MGHPGRPDGLAGAISPLVVAPRLVIARKVGAGGAATGSSAGRLAGCRARTEEYAATGSSAASTRSAATPFGASRPLLVGCDDLVHDEDARVGIEGRERAVGHGQMVLAVPDGQAVD